MTFSRAMSALFRQVDASVASFAVHAVTAAPMHTPDYLRVFLDSMQPGSLRARGVPERSARSLAQAIAADAPHILLDGLWRKECTPLSDDVDNDRGDRERGGTTRSGVGGRHLACALLHAPAPIAFSVLAAPITSGGAHVHYTLGDPVCLPPRLAVSFTERFVLLPAGAYPFDHAHWGPRAYDRAAASSASSVASSSASSIITRESEGLRASAIVLASFVQRWKVNPIAWAPWTNILRRGYPRTVLWLLQHPLDGPRRRLSSMLASELDGLDMRRMRVIARRPLVDHMRRVALADLTLDTHPYTAHTTAADALWADGGGGAPWLSLSASDDRMDSLLSAAVLSTAGALPLLTRTLRGYEDTAVGLVRSSRHK